MNGYPFAGPGGQKTLQRQAAEVAPFPVVVPEERHFLAMLNVFAPHMTPAQVYAGAIVFDNR